MPSFSCIMVELWHVKIRWWNLKTKRHCDYVIFIQEDAAICNVGLATAVVKILILLMYAYHRYYR